MRHREITQYPAQNIKLRSCSFNWSNDGFNVCDVDSASTIYIMPDDKHIVFKAEMPNNSDNTTQWFSIGHVEDIENIFNDRHINLFQSNLCSVDCDGHMGDSDIDDEHGGALDEFIEEFKPNNTTNRKK